MSSVWDDLQSSLWTPPKVMGHFSGFNIYSTHILSSRLQIIPTHCCFCFCLRKSWFYYLLKHFWWILSLFFWYKIFEVLFALFWKCPPLVLSLLIYHGVGFWVLTSWPFLTISKVFIVFCILYLECYTCRYVYVWYSFWLGTLGFSVCGTCHWYCRILISIISCAPTP